MTEDPTGAEPDLTWLDEFKSTPAFTPAPGQESRVRIELVIGDSLDARRLAIRDVGGLRVEVAVFGIDGLITTLTMSQSEQIALRGALSEAGDPPHPER